MYTGSPGRFCSADKLCKAAEDDSFQKRMHSSGCSRGRPLAEKYWWTRPSMTEQNCTEPVPQLHPGGMLMYTASNILRLSSCNNRSLVERCAEKWCFCCNAKLFKQALGNAAQVSCFCTYDMIIWRRCKEALLSRHTRCAA